MPPWRSLPAYEKAVFLLQVAARLDRLGDYGGSQAAKYWATKGLDDLQHARLRREELSELAGQGVVTRLREVAAWLWEPENERTLFAGLLRDACYELAQLTDREHRYRREGRER